MLSCFLVIFDGDAYISTYIYVMPKCVVVRVLILRSLDGSRSMQLLMELCTNTDPARLGPFRLVVNVI